MIAEEGRSQELALTQATATSSQGGRTARWAYTPKEHWEPRFREEYEAFKAARGDRRFEIWLGWSKEERRLVYLVSGMRSRKLQLRWKGQTKRVQRRAWVEDHDGEDGEQ